MRQTITFKYIIYVISEHETCDNPADHDFVEENVANGYKFDWSLIDAASAFTSSGRAYTLNVYIQAFTVVNQLQTQVINVSSINQNQANQNLHQPNHNQNNHEQGNAPGQNSNKNLVRDSINQEQQNVAF